jgi:hypothetical protein
VYCPNCFNINFDFISIIIPQSLYFNVGYGDDGKWSRQVTGAETLSDSPAGTAEKAENQAETGTTSSA